MTLNVHLMHRISLPLAPAVAMVAISSSVFSLLIATRSNVMAPSTLHARLLKLVAASAAEAKLGALFVNAQKAKVLHLTLAELGHPQPPMPIHIESTTTVGISNYTIKQQCSCTMKLQYFWCLDGKMQKHFTFYH
jgi:hypothetical protein